MPININRQEVLRYLKSHYFRSSSRDNGSLRGSKREKPVLMFSKTVFLDIASRDRTTCLYLKVSRSILKSLIWTKFLIFDRRHHKGDDAVDWRKFGFLYIFKTDSSLRPHLNILILGLNFHLVGRLRFTFTPNGKREFVPRDQVFFLIVVYCLLLLLKNKYFHASFIHKNCSGQFLFSYFLFWEILNFESDVSGLL